MPLSITTSSLSSSIARDDPVYWAESLGSPLWSIQKQIILSVANNRRTAVYGCHQFGKSRIAAIIVAWWIKAHPPGEAMVVTSAPTANQVRGILWSEISDLFAQNDLPGRLNQTEWWMRMPAGNEKMVAIGRKPSHLNPTSLQGWHRKFQLFLLDESVGVPKPLWTAGDSLIANEYSRFVAFSNPDDPNSEMAEVCKPGSGWNVIQVSAFDTPNFTGEPIPDFLKHLLIGPTWVEEKRKRWGEDNPLYIAKVLGQFPEISKDGLIPITWVKAAYNRDLKPSRPNELGVDIGGGSNRSVIAHRQGPVVRIIHRDQNPDTTITTGHIVKAIRSTQATRCKIDMQGIGQPIYNLLTLLRKIEKAKQSRRSFEVPENLRMLYAQLTSLKLELEIDLSSPPDMALLNCEIIGVRVGLPAEDSEQFFDIRAEGYWALRDRMQDGALSLDEAGSCVPLDDLMAQLCDLKQVPTPRGQIRIQSKKEKDPEKWAATDSPDDADAVMLAFLKVPKSGQWGVVGKK